MEHIGIDVHKRESQMCVLAEGGEVVLERRIWTQRERFAELLGQRPKTRVLLEASTESEWVARCLEELGHEVVVADPNFAAMYATRSRRVKTDKRDARTLAQASRIAPVHSDLRTRSHGCNRECNRESLEFVLKIDTSAQVVLPDLKRCVVTMKNPVTTAQEQKERSTFSILAELDVFIE